MIAVSGKKIDQSKTIRTGVMPTASQNFPAVSLPQKDPRMRFKKSLTEFSDDFFADGRNQPPMQDRENF
jgi:hypothetical protein